MCLSFIHLNNFTTSWETDNWDVSDKYKERERVFLTEVFKLYEVNFPFINFRIFSFFLFQVVLRLFYIVPKRYFNIIFSLGNNSKKLYPVRQWTLLFILTAIIQRVLFFGICVHPCIRVPFFKFFILVVLQMNCY